MRLNLKTIGFGAAMLLGTSHAALAAGTEAGTLVSNSIDVTYQSGGNTIVNNNADTAEFVVDYAVNLSVEGQDAGNTVTAEQGLDVAVLDFLLTNEGNKASGYNIDVTNIGTLGLVYDPTGSGAPGTYSVYLSTDGTFDPADTLIDVTGILNATDLNADESVHILIVANIPNTATDGLQDAFTVTATALNAGTNVVTTQSPTLDLAVENVVFADPGEDGIESDVEDLVVTAPQLTFTKTVAVISENRQGGFNCASGTPVAGAAAAIPGACLEYTITISNDPAATSSASTLQVTDVLPADVTYASHNVGGFTTVTYNAGTDTVTGNLTTLAAGATASFTIRVEVD